MQEKVLWQPSDEALIDIGAMRGLKESSAS